mmetsp:Transcript_8806/g.21506  ORF Transcript_8806/g.21506 Transcript_8806/m.21506 type:complete len:356 (-) Transcript_8806:501-1568(-)|eukprot:CAMPEP_0197195754 /NCGR_PEP_ID=MMETSP1423-20130617/31782_1 /TAXON_ID=476441 /ORGANISM="Pseudo-nitzschia heimii, Strain UNC1101" /LENGTH=355 /DNA_ID=CAMNT_0042649477 /DNA_START=227 /DNA_END=1294 /DNA_ORIENTATION=-
MFRLDKSPATGLSCRSMPLQHEYEAIKYPSILSKRSWQSMPNQQIEEEEQKQQQSNNDVMGGLCSNVQKVKGTNPPSPDRTASTQFSSNCSINNTSMNLDLSSDRSDQQVTGSSSFTTDVIKLQFSSETETDEEEDALVRGGKAAKGIKRSNSFSKIFKSLRKNIGLVRSASFDTGIPMISKRFLKKKKKSRLSNTDVDVMVVEGEGVEVTTKYSDESTYSENSDVDKNSIFVPKILRRSSTFATWSVTCGEESDNAGINEDDDKVRRVCNLMHNVINSQDEDSVQLGNSNSGPLGLGKNANEHPREKAIEVLSISSVSEATEADGFADFRDFMIFVNNEHKILEYGPEELQCLD